MSSAVLYLAIVALWGAVLVPMWLRRDGEGIGRLLHRRPDMVDQPGEAPSQADDSAVNAASEEPGGFDERAGSVESGRPSERAALEGADRFEEPGERTRRRRATRGAVIARRRRRTLGLSLLTLAAVITVATGVTPWWFVLPPALLLAGHLSLLRAAVRMDAARRQELRRAARLRAERVRRAAQERAEREARLAEETTRTAEVIELPGTGHHEEEVYDQYTDLRAVGD